MARHPIAEPSDESLVRRARRGDTRAFGQLWTRHARAGVALASRLVLPADAEDIVSEAFVSILRTVRNGRGPSAAFRPYLFATIRNMSYRWSRRDESVGLPDELAALSTGDWLGDASTDMDSTIQAFRELPDRWQAALWYSEVEGLEPRELAPLLGVSPNTASSLAFRAREGLRAAWLQTQLGSEIATPECEPVRAKLGDFARGRVTPRERARIELHLETCLQCSDVADQARGIASRLGALLGPLVLGPGIAAGILHGHAPAAIAAAALPAIGSGSALAGVAWMPAAVVAGIAAVTVTATLVLAPSPVPADPGASGDGSLGSTSQTTDGGAGSSAEELAPDATAPVTAAAVVQLDSSAAPPGMTVDTGSSGTLWPQVSGTAEPGAAVSVTVDGSATCGVTADAEGAWTCTEMVLGTGRFDIAATQVDPAGNRSAPAIASVMLTAPDAREVGNACAHGGRCNLQVGGVGGAEALVLVDGTVASQIHFNPGGQAVVDVDLAPGDHIVTVRYVDVASSPHRNGPEMSLPMHAG